MANIREISEQLNAATKSLNASVASIEDSLKRLNLGVEAWVPLQPRDADGNGYDLGYGRVSHARGRKWGILIRKNYGASPSGGAYTPHVMKFCDAPREIRMLVPDKLPHLFEALDDAAQLLTKQLQNALTGVQEIVAAIGEVEHAYRSK